MWKFSYFKNEWAEKNAPEFTYEVTEPIEGATLYCVPSERILTRDFVFPVTVTFKSWLSLVVLFVYVLKLPYAFIIIEPPVCVVTLNPPRPVNVLTAPIL